MERDRPGVHAGNQPGGFFAGPQLQIALYHPGQPVRSDEAAFYGPKIDVQIWSVIGREFTLATNQVDFSQGRSFKLHYTTQDNQSDLMRRHFMVPRLMCRYGA